MTYIPLGGIIVSHVNAGFLHWQGMASSYYTERKKIIMEHGVAISATIFFGIFFVVISFLQFFSNKISFPYTVALLIVGFLAQQITHLVGLESHVVLSNDIIFYVLLPLLLFDSAMRINIHQFNLHFKTITFLTTFGLLVSVGVVGMLMAAIFGIPLGYGLLFGTIISATDPIAVVGLFKSLHAPKRLAMLIEGESMFNDATAVILFKFVSAIVIAATAVESTEIAITAGQFVYTFIGSIGVGAALGYITTKLISKVESDHTVEATITVALAISVFIFAEHFLGLSGVIAVVIAGIVIGNIGRTAISRDVIEFIDDLWEYISYLAISLVFFFATFTLDINFLFEKPILLLGVVLITLVARSVAIYSSFFITNRLFLFKREPNVPLSWQHVLNWGGLRGVIPLVLVYSLPDSFVYKTELVHFTLVTFLFTLFVNGLSIKSLLVALRVHLPKKEESIIEEEKHIFDIEAARNKLRKLPKKEFDEALKKKIDKELTKKELLHKKKLLSLSNQREFLRSLKLQAIRIEREKLDELFHDGFINETVYFTFETQLDLQHDALEYPEVYSGRGVASGGLVYSHRKFENRLNRIQRLMSTSPLFCRLAGITIDKLIETRLLLLRTRVVASEEVLQYLKKLDRLFAHNSQSLRAISIVKEEYEFYRKRNKNQIKELKREYPRSSRSYQRSFIQSFIKSASQI